MLIHEGRPSDRAYVIEHGVVVVSLASREAARLQASDGVGQIALVQSVPRTATVTAATPAPDTLRPPLEAALDWPAGEPLDPSPGPVAAFDA
ncbi:MAG: hypothetical protein QOC86_2798 [Gaiellales bacterium]|nr:hypothetical protein [Gaiellales bacterium]